MSFGFHMDAPHIQNAERGQAPHTTPEPSSFEVKQAAVVPGEKDPKFPILSILGSIEQIKLWIDLGVPHQYMSTAREIPLAICKTLTMWQVDPLVRMLDHFTRTRKIDRVLFCQIKNGIIYPSGMIPDEWLTVDLPIENPCAVISATAVIDAAIEQDRLPVGEQNFSRSRLVSRDHIIEYMYDRAYRQFTSGKTGRPIFDEHFFAWKFAQLGKAAVPNPDVELFSFDGDTLAFKFSPKRFVAIKIGERIVEVPNTQCIECFSTKISVNAGSYSFLINLKGVPGENYFTPKCKCGALKLTPEEWAECPKNQFQNHGIQQQAVTKELLTLHWLQAIRYSELPILELLHIYSALKDFYPTVESLGKVIPGRHSWYNYYKNVGFDLFLYLKERGMHGAVKVGDYYSELVGYSVAGLLLSVLYALSGFLPFSNLLFIPLSVWGFSSIWRLKENSRTPAQRYWWISALIFNIIFVVKLVSLIAKWVRKKDDVVEKQLPKSKVINELENQGATANLILALLPAYSLMVQSITGIFFSVLGFNKIKLPFPKDELLSGMSHFTNMLRAFSFANLAFNRYHKDVENEADPDPEVFQKFAEATFNEAAFEHVDDESDKAEFRQWLKDNSSKLMLIATGVASIIAFLSAAFYILSRPRKKHWTKPQNEALENEGEGKKNAKARKGKTHEPDEYAIQRKEEKPKKVAHKNDPHYISPDMKPLLDLFSRPEIAKFVSFSVNNQFSSAGRPRTMDPHKLLDYDAILIRIGPLEGRFNPKSLDPRVAGKLLAMLSNRAAQHGTFMKASPDDGRTWFALPHQFKQANENGSVTGYTKYLADSINECQALTSTSMTKIAFSDTSHFGLLRTLTNVVKNEALLGHNFVNIDKIKKSIGVIVNHTFGTQFNFFCCNGQYITCAHGVLDKDLVEDENAVEGRVYTGLYNEQYKFTVLPTNVSKLADWAILDKHSSMHALISLRYSKLKDYIGIAFMISPGEMNHVAIGKVILRGDMLWHNLPTLPGWSGAPIFNLDQEVIGFHKASIGISNVGVPISVVLDRKKEDIFMLHSSPIDAVAAKVMENQTDSVGTDELDVLLETLGVRDESKPGLGTNYTYQIGKHTLDLGYMPDKLLSEIKLFTIGEGDIPTSLAEMLGADHEKVCLISSFNKEYEDSFISYPYAKHYADFGLDPPEELEYAMTEPDIFTVWKDAAKYTIERDTHDELDEDPFFSYALENIRTLMNRCVGPCERLSWLQISESATMTSSNGFPVRLIAPIKKNFFSDPEFEQSYYIFRDAILCGGQPDIFFEAIGKIELRDMDRIEMQKYRTFMSASTYLYALEKEFFGDFLNQWGDSPFFYNHTTNGWSPWYGGWQELYRYIHAPRFVKMPGGVKLDSLHGIDFPKWDSSVLRLIIKELIAMMVSAIPDSKMSPVEKIHFIRWYTAHVIEAYMVLPIDKFVSVVIKIFRGVKSGQLITLLINCLINNLRHCYAMQRILSDVYCKGRPYYDRQWTLDQIEYYTAFAACGDDFTVNFLVELKMHYDDVKLLIFKYFNAGEALGLYPDQYEYDGAMSFAGATTMFLQNYPYLVPNLPRLHANVAYMGQGMTIPDYLQKLDAMVRILVVSDYDYATKVLKYRDFLVSLFIDYDTAVRSVASGFCSIYEAYCAHKYSSELLEKFGESIIHDPNKIDYLDNQSLSMNIAYHGNYCGPGWSAGKYQDSVIDDSVEAIDEFDESCKQHDKSYYLKEDLDEADEIFYNQNIGKSFKRSIAALAVRMVNGKRGTKKTVKKAVRKLEKKALGKTVRMRRPPALRRNRRRRGGMATTSAPIAIGSVERSRNFFKMSSKGTGNTLTVSGRDVLAVLSTPSSDTGAGSELYAVDIAPSAMGITRLRKFSELYEKWLPIEFKFVFRTSRKTTDSGQIMMYADVDPYDSPLSGIAAINKGEAASGHTSFSIWNNSMATYRPDPKQQSLYCSPNAIKGFEVPAKFRVIVVTPPEANLELGLIEVHWKVKLFKPTIEEISEINPYGMQFASGTGTSSGLLINGGVDISGGYTNKLPFTLNATTGEVTCSKVGSYLAIITTLLTGGYTVGTTKLDFLTAGGAQPIFGYADDMCRANYSNALCTSIQFDVISVGGSLLPFLSSAALTGPFVTRLTLFELHNFDDLGKVKQDPRFLALEDKVDQLSSILARALKVEGTTKSTSGSSTPGRSEAKRGNLNLSSFSLDG